LELGTLEGLRLGLLDELELKMDELELGMELGLLLGLELRLELKSLLGLELGSVLGFELGLELGWLDSPSVLWEGRRPEVRVR